MKNNLLILIPLIYLSVSNAEEHPPMLQTMQDGIKLELEGVVVCDENGRNIHDKKLKVKLGSQPSLKKPLMFWGQDTSVNTVVPVAFPGYSVMIQS